MMSASDKALLERIENDFTYHAPTSDKQKKYERLRDMAKDLALAIADECPDSRERSLAITQVEQSVMWANASIARAPDL